MRILLLVVVLLPALGWAQPSPPQRRRSTQMARNYRPHRYVFSGLVQAVSSHELSVKASDKLMRFRVERDSQVNSDVKVGVPVEVDYDTTLDSGVFKVVTAKVQAAPVQKRKKQK